jgi:hypothetical protein
MPSLIRKSDVFLPSASSLIFVILLTFVIALITVLTKLQDSELIGLLIGRESSAALLEASKSDVTSTADTVFGSELLGRSVVFGLWMFIGLLVFVIIGMIAKGIGDVREIETELQSANVNKKVFLTGLVRDTAFRLVMAVLWSGLMILSLQYILPFFVAALYVSIGPFSTAHDHIMTMLAGLVVFIPLHAHVIFARFLVGRIRLFGV